MDTPFDTPPDLPQSSATLVLLGATVDYLESKNKDLAVALFPDKPEAYRLNHPKGAYLVQFAAGRFGEPKSTDLVVVDRKRDLAIAIMARQLNGANGAIALLDRLMTQMTGWKPPAHSKCVPIEERFLRENEGIWTYVARFRTSTLLVETADYPEPGARLAGVSGVIEEEIGA
jgi:hypothetical protein